MSDQSETNGERATVALVNAKVATVDAKLDGLTSLVTAEFNALRGMPTAVAALTERQLHSEARLTDLEKKDDERRGWRSTHLPQLLIGVIGLIIAATNVWVLLHVS